MVRRLLVAALLGGAALATPASADPIPDVSTSPVGPVHYEVHAEDGYVAFYTSIPGQPLFGGYVDLNSGTACVGFSLQVPVCTARLTERLQELINVDAG